MKFLFKEIYSPIFIVLFAISMHQAWTGSEVLAALILGLGAVLQILFGDKYNPDKYTKEDIKKAFIAGRYDIASSQGFDIWSKRKKDNESKS